MEKRKVLVIEDNEQNLYLATYLLETHGLQVLQARNGQFGVELATAETPDLILLDIQLPVMDGFEVAKRLKQDDATKSIPVVGISSHAMTGDRRGSWPRVPKSTSRSP